MSPIFQTSFLVGTFFAASYSKPALRLFDRLQTLWKKTILNNVTLKMIICYLIKWFLNQKLLLKQNMTSIWMSKKIILSYLLCCIFQIIWSRLPHGQLFWLEFWPEKLKNDKQELFRSELLIKRQTAASKLPIKLDLYLQKSL